MSNKTQDPLSPRTSPNNERTEQSPAKSRDMSKLLTATTTSNALPKPVVTSPPPAASPKPSEKLRNSKSKHKSQDKIKLKVSSGKKEALSPPMSLLTSFDEASSMEESLSSSQSMSERQGDKGPLIWDDKVLTKATIPGLLQLLLKFQDRSFIDTFLMTTDYWTTPQEITELLISIYKCPPKDEEVTLRLRVLNIIKKLIEYKYSAWRNDSAWETKFNCFLTELDEKYGEQGKSCAALIRQAMKDSTQESPRRLVAGSPAPGRKRFEFFDAPLDEVARQLTIVDHFMFRRIPIDEFYHKNFEKKPVDPESKSNLQKSVDHFNEVSYWAATQILMAPNYKIRAQYIVKIIQLMDLLRQNGNFFSLMALYSTLSMSVISNLHRSWKELPPAVQTMHKSLVAFLNHTSNYKPYRDALDATTEGGIPILGLVMRDLIYIEEMETNEEGYINWEKMTLLAKVLGQVLRFQKQKYTYTPQPAILDFFADLRACSLVMNEDELYSLYQKIKPEEDEGLSGRDSIDQGGRTGSRVSRRDSVGSADKDRKPPAVERRVSGRTNFSSSLAEYKRNAGGDMNSVTFGIIRSCFAGIGQQIQLTDIDPALKTPLTKALTDFLEMYDQLNPRDVAGAESITEPAPVVSVNMVDLLDEVTSSFNMAKRVGIDGTTITASYVVSSTMPQVIQANKQRIKSMILYHMFALATQVSNTLVIAPFMARDQADSSSDSDFDESSASGPLSGGPLSGAAKVVENIRLKFQISDFKPASLSGPIDAMNKRAPDAIYEALSPVADLAEEMREELIYNADTGHVLQFIISTQEIKESMDLKNKQRVLQQLSAKAPASWTTAEVTKWLECQDLGLYKGSFIENSISGKEILDLEEDDLKEIGVTKLGHLKKLHKAICELREAKPVVNIRDQTPPRTSTRDVDSIAFKCTFNGDLRMMKFRLTTLADFTERIATEYGDVVVKFKDEDDDLILLHETNWDLLVGEAEAKRSVNLVISQRQDTKLSEQVIRQLGIATTTEAVIVANSNGEIQWVNAAGEQLSGWKSSELLGLYVNKVLSKEMMYYTALEGQYNESEEYTVIHTTDTVRKRDRSTATIQLEIQDHEVSASGHDMIMWLFKLKPCEGSASPGKDEVKNVLTQAREAAEKSKDSAIIFDEAGNVQAFNKVACDTFGYKLFEIVGKKVFVLIPHYPSIAEFTQACAAGPVLTQDKHGSLLSVQAKLQQIKDGSKLYYSVSLKKL